MSMMFESDSVWNGIWYHSQIIQTSIRICRAIIFYLSQHPAFPKSVREGDLLFWTLSLIRAMQQRTWGEGNRVLLQLVCVLEQSDG